MSVSLSKSEIIEALQRFPGKFGEVEAHDNEVIPPIYSLGDEDREVINTVYGAGSHNAIFYFEKWKPLKESGGNLKSLYPKELPRLKPISANDLMKKDIPELRFVIDKICPSGFGILASPPKYYKSFLALQICICICQGQKVLGQNTKKTKCLYFDLESTDRRPHERLKAMGVTEIEGLQFITQDEMPKVGHRMVTLENGFADILEEYLNDHLDIGFVVIDVFRKIRSDQKRGQSLYDHDYEDIEKLQTLASKRNICLLLLHHTTKLKDESDPFNNMGGSTGILGASDFAWILGKDKRSSDEATLFTTGRDIESTELAVRFNKTALKWEYIGTAEEIQENKKMEEYLNHHITQTIKKLIEINGGNYEGTSTDIIKASNYYGTPIYEKPQQVGRYIQSHYELFSIEAGINIDYRTISNQRIYKITKK